ncbi:hypothetical protein SESBI_22364 [Sesbania bispinosa]|nr:hypothetical protein SESBI_22364 [Sesbania bispinosa]
MGNGNSSNSDAQDGQAAKVGSTERRQHVPKPMQRKPSKKAEKVGLGMYPDQHVKSLPNNIGPDEEYHNPAPDVANGHKNRENETDPFSAFIHNARKKLRTVSTMRKSYSLKKGKKVNMTNIVGVLVKLNQLLELITLE